MRTELNELGKVLVINEVSDTNLQAYTICVKNPEDWQEIHDYIITVSDAEGIPKRKIKCISDLNFSSKRSTYNISKKEAELLRKHDKIEWVVLSSMHNPVVLEQRKFDEEIDRHAIANRFKQDVTNLRTNTAPGNTLNFTQWGLSRHSKPSNEFVGVNTTTISEDVAYSLSGKNVDVVIMDTGVRWDHPEFLLPKYTSVPSGATVESVSRVRDILIHGQEEYGINWSSHGLVSPGTGTLANYTKANALQSATFNGSWHGSHVAGTAAGNQFGAAFEANIWSIACVDRSDVGFSDPSDGFDYIRVWHKNKPINPETGRRNPTIVNGSWGLRQFVLANGPTTYPYTVNFRGTSHNGSDVIGSNNYLPAFYYMDLLQFLTFSNGNPALWFEFTSKHAVSQSTTDELFDDSDCDDLIVVLAAGNSGNGNGKQDISGGVDYDNQILGGHNYYGNYTSEALGAVDEYCNRVGTPALAHQGQSDAPIIVGSLDSAVYNVGISSERKSIFSNTGPSIDVWAAGSTILSPHSGGHADPRNSSFYNDYLNGTSMATPNVCGVIACYLESNPSATRVDVRNWMNTHGTITVDSGVGNLFYDQYGDTNPVGAGTSVNYWSDSHGLKGASPKILYNPFANNTSPSINGLNITGISFAQS